MKLTTALLAATTALTAPGIASAATLTLNTTLKSYYGNPAYIAIYVTDAQGRYVRTLHMAGSNARYFADLRGWYAASGGAWNEIQGLTGASVGAGRTLKVSVEVADALIDAGYQVRVDVAAENIGVSPADVAVPLTSDQSGKAVPGRGFISSFDFTL